MNDNRNNLLNYKKGYENCAKFYDLFAKNDDLTFFLSYAEKQKSPILDLACGTGRVTIPLANAGYHVTGLESSRAMLNVAQKKSAKFHENVRKRITFIQGDMTSFEIEEKFNLIIIPTSFGHCLTTKQQLNCLSSIRKHLARKGLFILDLYPGGTLEKKGFFKDEPIKLDNNQIIIRSCTYETDFIKQISNYKIKFEIYEDGKLSDEIIENSSVAVIYNREINLLLEIAGFEILNEFGNWDKSSYQSNINCKQRILVLKLK